MDLLYLIGHIGHRNAVFGWEIKFGLFLFIFYLILKKKKLIAWSVTKGRECETKFVFAYMFASLKRCMIDKLYSVVVREPIVTLMSLL